MRSVKAFVSRLLPRRLKRAVVRGMIRVLNALGYNVARIDDMYSPLPALSKLRDNFDRWSQPSGLVGIQYDISKMEELLRGLLDRYYGEWEKLPSYSDVVEKGYGQGYTPIDAMLLYFMVRYYKPRRFVEVGSGIST